MPLAENKYCPSCIKAKLTRKPARRARGSGSRITVEKFGDLVCADHIISMSEAAAGLTGEKDALLIVDKHSGYLDVFPLMTKSAVYASSAFLEYFGNTIPSEAYIWSDSAPELIKSVADMGIPHGKATPGRHTANGYCE